MHKTEIQVGDVIVFKGKGLLFEILSRLLKLLEPDWDRWGWHLAIAEKEVDGGWILIEALAPRVQEKFHDWKELWERTKAYTWLDSPPSKQKMSKFKELYLGYPYDVTAYIGITFAYLFWKVTGKSFRMIDTEHLCWETVAAFCRFMGKPLQPIYMYPMIWRIMGRLEQGK